MALVFDTETTGLPLKDINRRFYSYRDTDKYDNARIVSIAFVIDGEEHYFIVKPDGFHITNSEFHGITQEIAERDGVPMSRIVEVLKQNVDRLHTIVGHNLEFDYMILMSELYRLNELDLIAQIKGLKRYCTMRESTDLCQLPSKSAFSKYKFPKLQELYKFLFKTEFEGAHHALNDARATYQCYVKLQSQIP